jgi:hypothetical protein
MQPARVRSAALLLALSLPACGDDRGDATDATTTGVTSATSPTAGLTTGAVAPTTSDTATTGVTGVSASDGTSEGSDTGALKLDVGMPDFGEPVGGDGCTFIDVLFVVDISASMKEEKQNLDANFPAFVAVLDDYVADPNNGASGYRLGVTNSSIVDNADGQSTMGLDGALFDGDNIFEDDCELGGDVWIDGPGPTVTSDFSCLAPNPKSSCNSCTDLGKERPLDAIEMFIDKSNGGVNSGFYRGAESLFVVVILTDEDDDASNSTTTPAATKAALDAFADGEQRYVIVTIAGPQDQSCDSDFGSATPAPTLHAFTSMVANGLMGDICQGDLAQTLDAALALIQQSCDALPPPIG